jgi:3',5'-cyclic AMP phosphodiesterase CpdA
MNVKKTAPLVLVSVLLFAGCVRTQGHTGGKPPQEALIYVTNDTHFLAESLHDDGPRFRSMITGGDGKNIAAQDALFGALGRAIEAERPDVLLINGDLTFNGERESHRGLANHLAEFEKSGIAVLVIPGNHDINNPYARSFFNNTSTVAAGVSPNKFKRIYGKFGYDEAVSKDRNSLSYVAEPLAGLRFLMLDSNRYKENKRAPVPGGAINQATRNWLRREARRARADGALLVTALHHSIMNHHPMVNEAFTIDDAAGFEDLLVEEGIRFVLSGHIHAQEISMRARTGGTVYDIATSALSVYPHQIGTRRLASDASGTGAWQYRVKPLDVEAWARASGIQDQRFLNFSEWSLEFFSRTSAGMVTRRLENISFGPGELEALSSLMALLNARYFSGTSGLNAFDVPEMPGYQLLNEANFEFLSNYTRTILEERAPPDTELYIK